MLSATLEIKLGEGAHDYSELVDSLKGFRHSTIKTTGKKDSVVITVEAESPKVLLSSLNAMLKQLRIVSSVGSAIDEGLKRKTKQKLKK